MTGPAMIIDLNYEYPFPPTHLSQNMTPPVMRAFQNGSIQHQRTCSISAVFESTLSTAVPFVLIVFVLAFAGDSSIAVAQSGSESSSSETYESAESANLEATHSLLPIRMTDQQVNKTAAENKAAAGTGNNAWVLLCSALVFFMIAPGLALFYSGLVRKKNVLSVFIQCLFITAIMSIVWSLYGYSLAFSNGGGLNPWIGGFEYVFMNGVSRTWNPITGSPETPMWFSGGLETSITRYTHMIFQGMFFSIAPVIICGALAERVKFHGMVAFSILWGTFVYCPIVHWIWAGGMLSYPSGLLGGSLDFAGGTVVHVSAGVSALVAAIILGPRLGFGKDPMPPHNLTYTAIGAAMLWFGWFGFNAGNAMAANEVAASAFATTHLAAAAGAVGWWFLEWRSRGKATLLGISSGVVAGLVCITPAAGFVQPMPALLFGFSGGVGCYFACSLCKHLAGYDDSLDAFGIHGVAGILGAILTALFATRACNDVGQGKTLGLLEGGPLLPGQLASIVVVVLYSALTSLVLLKVVDWTIGLRVSASDERQGLDVQQHGEEGYIFL
jgi:ammonium transporter, Amt family